MKKNNKTTHAMLLIALMLSMVAPSYMGVTRGTLVPQNTKEEILKKNWLVATRWQSPEVTQKEKIAWVQPACANVPIEKYTRTDIECEVYEEQKIKLEAKMREYFIALVEEAKRIAEEKAARRRAAKERKKKDLKNLRKFYEEFTYDKTDMSQSLGLSKKFFVEVIKALPHDHDKTRFFKRNSGFMWEEAKKYNFNEFLIVGVIANESLWASDPVAKNNFSSQRIGETDNYYSYETAEEGIEVLAKLLAKKYFNPKQRDYYNGPSLKGVNKEYCEPVIRDDGSKDVYGWAEDISICIRKVIGEYLKTL